jgi:putative transposase
MLARTFGCVRVVWNRTLAARHVRYAAGRKSTSYAETDRALTAMKCDPGLAFLSEVSSVPLQQALRHQHAAFQAFFARRARCPRFKSRRGRQSATYTRSAFSMRDGVLRLAKISQPLRFVWTWPGVDETALDPTSVTVSRDPCGRWHVTFHVDVPDPAPLPATGQAVGVDLGVRNFAVTSDGGTIPNPRRLERRARNLARYQRRLARCQKGSANRRKATVKLARAHRKVAASRADFLHRASVRLVRDNDVIVIEDLAVQNMIRNRHLARVISDCGWGEFRRQLEYKCERAGRQLVVTGRWYPSSRTCSACGHLLAQLSLSTRTWQCLSCGTRHDRDVNAAKNILAAGLAVAACGGDVRHSGSSRVRSPAKQEPVPRGPESPSVRAGSSQSHTLRARQARPAARPPGALAPPAPPDPARTGRFTCGARSVQRWSWEQPLLTTFANSRPPARWAARPGGGQCRHGVHARAQARSGKPRSVQPGGAGPCGGER